MNDVEGGEPSNSGVSRDGQEVQLHVTDVDTSHETKGAKHVENRPLDQNNIFKSLRDKSDPLATH